MEKLILNWKVFVMVLVLMSGTLVLTLAQDDSPQANFSVSVSVSTNQTETNEPNPKGYSYEDNLADPQCWYNLNFCNLGYNLTNIDSTPMIMINTLKQVNYQMQGDLMEYQRKAKTDKYFKILVFILLGLVAIWNIYLMFKKTNGRREK